MKQHQWRLYKNGEPIPRRYYKEQTKAEEKALYLILQSKPTEVIQVVRERTGGIWREFRRQLNRISIS